MRRLGAVAEGDGLGGRSVGAEVEVEVAGEGRVDVIDLNPEVLGGILSNVELTGNGVEGERGDAVLEGV